MCTGGRDISYYERQKTSIFVDAFRPWAVLTTRAVLFQEKNFVKRTIIELFDVIYAPTVSDPEEGVHVLTVLGRSLGKV